MEVQAIIASLDFVYRNSEWVDECTNAGKLVDLFSQHTFLSLTDLIASSVFQTDDFKFMEFALKHYEKCEEMDEDSMINAQKTREILSQHREKIGKDIPSIEK